MKDALVFIFSDALHFFGTLILCHALSPSISVIVKNKSEPEP